MSNLKRKRLYDKSEEEKESNLSEKKRESFIDAYFELKDNIIIFSNTLELVKKGDLRPVKRQLARIKIDRVLNLGKDVKLSKREFEIIDELYLVKIIKNKIEFYISIFLNKNTNLLEFRAEIDKSIEDLKAVEKRMKDIFDDIE